jgi:catechol 2,3-dioxygenase-like lactoylglutathione lyase family enzyme
MKPTCVLMLTTTLVLLSTCSHQTNTPIASSRPSIPRATYDQGGSTVSTVSVRYIVNDVESAIAFYTKYLDFNLDLHPAPGFATLSRGNLRLLLNAPGAGGAGQAMPDGRKPEPGGWNRIQVPVADLARRVESLRKAGVHFRNDIVVGQGGKQILLEDPSGNPVELFEAPPKTDNS